MRELLSPKTEGAETPVLPHRPVVPADATGELRLGARKFDTIPEYPY